MTKQLPGKIYSAALLLSLLFIPEGSASAFQVQDSTGKRIVITVVGDIMLGTSFPSASFLPPGNDPVPLLAEVADTLKYSDITAGNLEGAFLDGGEPNKKCRDTTKCYLFRMPESYAGALKFSGFDFISLANNHTGDFGWPAVSRTKEILDSLGIRYAGLTDIPYAIIEKDSVIYGFCAFAPNAGTLNLTDIEGAAALVRYLADSCDIVIVSFHGGAEGADFQRVPKATEYFYGEDRGDVHLFAHTMIDNGADVVFGHGPHVTRATEVYKDRFIAYSLGNFCTYRRINVLGVNGIAPIIRLNLEKSGKLVSGNIIPVYQGSDRVVRIDPEMRVVRKIRELNSLDFPDDVSEVTEEGEIKYK